MESISSWWSDRKAEAGEMKDTMKDGTCVDKLRTSGTLLLIVVFVAIFLDNMLLTTVVPILPTLLHEISHENTPDIDDTPRTYTEQSKFLEYTNELNETVKVSSHLQCSNVSEILDSHNPYSKAAAYYSRGRPWQHEFRYFNCRNITNEVIEPSPGNPNSRRLEQPVNRTYMFNATKHEVHVHKKEDKNEVLKIGFLFGSKATIQLITNVFIGPLTNKIGFGVPMFSGFVIMLASSIIFAFGRSYGVLFFARALQGIGSSCSSVSGLGMLAGRFTEDNERGKAMSIALSGLAIGVLFGPPFGGLLYEYVNQAAPFLILAGLALLDGALQLVVLKPTVKPEEIKGTPLLTLLRDPYILLATGAITFGNMGIAMLEPTLPLWMIKTMDASKWQQGAAFLPASISYMLGTNVFGHLANKMGRWLCCMVGFVVIAVSLAVIPLATNIWHLVVPNMCLGFAIGMVDSAMFPQMGLLVDLRHEPVYGSVYAIADVAFCLGFSIGPIVSGLIVQHAGFEWMLWTMALICICYAPLLFFMRTVPPKEDPETSALMLADDKPNSYGGDGENSTALDDIVSHDDTSASAGSNDSLVNDKEVNDNTLTQP